MDKLTQYVKPKEGVLIRDPKSKKLMPNTGFDVPWIGPLGRYWRRRVNCGDVIIIDKPSTNK